MGLLKGLTSVAYRCAIAKRPFIVTFLSAMVNIHSSASLRRKIFFFSGYYCGQESCGKLTLAPLVFLFEKLAISLAVFQNC